MRHEADVVVVGGGGAGLAAAAEAARLGRSAIVIEKNAKPGGTTALAVGSIMAAGSRIQKRAGVEDSPAQHAAEMAELAARLGIEDSAELRQLFTEHAGETVDFLESIGVDFLGPLEQPPFPTRRFHVALPGGRAYVRRLAIFCSRAGVSIHTNTRARRFLVEDGRVCGVETDGGVLRANGGVVLASGDFSANSALRASCSRLVPRACSTSIRARPATARKWRAPSALACTSGQISRQRISRMRAFHHRRSQGSFRACRRTGRSRSP